VLLLRVLHLLAQLRRGGLAGGSSLGGRLLLLLHHLHACHAMNGQQVKPKLTMLPIPSAIQ
jgi:hypothetical protein